MISKTMKHYTNFQLTELITRIRLRYKQLRN